MKTLPQVVMVTAIVTTVLAAYDRLVVRPGQRIGIVDVAEVYRQKEAEFTLTLTRATSDAEREQAMRVARAFAQRLPSALDELPRECGCLVLLRTALAAPMPRAIDLTHHLRRKVETP
jgi:hypothetical protein